MSIFSTRTNTVRVSQNSASGKKKTVWDHVDGDVIVLAKKIIIEMTVRRFFA